jgi:nucleotide-binding universal stress UspA family protein
LFDTILVPLDGSSLAEAALPMALFLARAFDSRIILFHAVERDPPPEIHGERHLADQAEAEAYLETIAAKLDASGEILRHVHVEKTENVAASIVQHMEELHPDLVVMCSHGRGGLKHAIVGGLAVRVIGKGSVPVLLVRSEWKDFAHPEFGKIVVALDSASLHDLSIDNAVSFADATGADLELLTVVPTFGTLKGHDGASGLLLPSTARIALEMEENAMREHLGDHFSELERRGLKAGFRVVRGDPAKKIVSAAQKAGNCLIVLGTHGRSGMDAFWAGSVMPKVVSLTDKPLLLVPIHS